MTDRLRWAVWLAVDLALMGLLRGTGPEPAAIRAAAADPQDWVERVGPDAAAVVIAGLLCWATLFWVTVALLLVASASAPGTLGRCGEACAAYLVPAALRRGAAVALGISLGTAALTSTAVAEPSPRSDSPASTAPAAVADAQDHRSYGNVPAAAGIDWPLDPAPIAATPSGGGHPTGPTGPTGVSRSPGPHRGPPLTPDSPTTAASQATATRPAPTVGSRPTEPGPATGGAETGKDLGSAPSGTRSGAPPASVPAPVAGAPADAGARPRSALVRPGDCLWLIAARRLGPQASAAEVAGEWPRWYAMNRQLIGADPDLIRPGQVLVAPSDPARTASFSIWRPQ
jgi:nucleoid-associated protein YgaU